MRLRSEEHLKEFSLVTLPYIYTTHTHIRTHQPTQVTEEFPNRCSSNQISFFFNKMSSVAFVRKKHRLKEYIEILVTKKEKIDQGVVYISNIWMEVGGTITPFLTLTFSLYKSNNTVLRFVWRNSRGFHQERLVETSCYCNRQLKGNYKHAQYH